MCPSHSMWGPGAALSSLFVGSRHGAQVVRLCRKRFYLLSHLTNPQLPRLQLCGTQNGIHFLMVIHRRTAPTPDVIM